MAINKTYKRIKQSINQINEIVKDDNFSEHKKLIQLLPIFTKCQSIITQDKDVMYLSENKVPQIFKIFDKHLPFYKKQSRRKEVVAARFLLFYYLKSMTTLSLVEIARHVSIQIGRKSMFDHTTIIHGINFCKDALYIGDALIMELNSKISNELLTIEDF